MFDGAELATHDDWVVLVRGERIESVGPASEVKAPDDARLIDLPGATLLPGLIDAHSHLYLHPYNETTWDDQVLKESLTLRVCRATQHARALTVAFRDATRLRRSSNAAHQHNVAANAVEQRIGDPTTVWRNRKARERRHPTVLGTARIRRRHPG